VHSMFRSLSEGQYVQLLGGGPVMKVAEVDTSHALCRWTEQGEPREARCLSGMLVVIYDPERAREEAAASTEPQEDRA
jgi:uncharacterized protein YodC (DUF2158 family)